MEKFHWIKEIVEGAFQLQHKNPHFYQSSLQHYLSYYRFQISHFHEYRCGYEKVQNKKIFYQFFINKEAVHTVILVHGYLDHSGGLSRTINYLLCKNINVITVDLPGHGFSEGEEGGIAHFNDYISPVQIANELASIYLKGTMIHGVGHSTGGAIIFHAASEKRINVEKLALIAPLYYPYKWNVIRRTYHLFQNIVSDRKRLFKKNSSDEVYYQFLKNDPLQGRILKVDWLHALEEWQKEFQNCHIVNIPVYILQGTKDTTVEWKKNLFFYKSKCTKMQTALFEGGRHQLLNERLGVRKLVFNQLASFLKQDDDKISLT